MDGKSVVVRALQNRGSRGRGGQLALVGWAFEHGALVHVAKPVKTVVK